MVAVAGLAARRALALAGGRLVPHHQRDQWPDTPRYELHTKVGPVSPDVADRVLRGAWAELGPVTEELDVDPAQLESLLHGFCVELLTRGMAYQTDLLRGLVDAAYHGRRLNVDPLAAAA